MQNTENRSRTARIIGRTVAVAAVAAAVAVPIAVAVAAVKVDEPAGTDADRY